MLSRTMLILAMLAFAIPALARDDPPHNPPDTLAVRAAHADARVQEVHDAIANAPNAHKLEKLEKQLKAVEQNAAKLHALCGC